MTPSSTVVTFSAQMISSRLSSRVPASPGVRPRLNNLPDVSASRRVACQCPGALIGEPPGLKKSPLRATTSPKLSMNRSSADSPPMLTKAPPVAASPIARCS